MNRRERACALWSSAALALACSSEVPTPGAGMPSTSGGFGASAGAGGNGNAATSGAAGASASGSAGVGSGVAGASGAAGSLGGLGGAGGGGAGGGGAAGSAGASGAAGAAATGGNGGNGGGSPGVQRVLLYHFSTLVIDSLQAQLTLLRQRLEGWGYEVRLSDDPAEFEPSKLAQLVAVGMINTCFEPFGAGQSGSAEAAALAAFVAAGGGLFGTHCASVTFQSAEPPHPYNAVIGGRGGDGYFDGASQCRSVASHATTTALPAAFEYNGNLDNADYLAPDTTVLVKCKWSGADMRDVAVSWYRTPGMGRVFYTNFAKEEPDLASATLGDGHILVGLSWVLGR
ncbi:MAG TPA: ThuA domain-containing protein [Polyangiaceae bacterium]